MAYDEVADLERHRQEVAGLIGMLNWLELETSGYKRGLDIGGGGGMHAPFLFGIVDHIIVSDIIRYLERDDGHYVTNFVGKLQRNGIELDLSRLEFNYADACDLQYRDDWFDFAVSINAFEHIPDPAKALAEAIRVVRPGGVIVLQFDPLWHSPFGHHLWHLNLPPWAHLLHSEAELDDLIRQHGGNDDDMRIYRTEMNGVRFHDFRRIFEQKEHLFEKSKLSYWAKEDHEEPNLAHENFQACLDAGYDREDLMVRGMQFVGKLADVLP